MLPVGKHVLDLQAVFVGQDQVCIIANGNLRGTFKGRYSKTGLEFALISLRPALEIGRGCNPQDMVQPHEDRCHSAARMKTSSCKCCDHDVHLSEWMNKWVSTIQQCCLTGECTTQGGMLVVRRLTWPLCGRCSRVAGLDVSRGSALSSGHLSSHTRLCKSVSKLLGDATCRYITRWPSAHHESMSCYQSTSMHVEVLQKCYRILECSAQAGSV